MTNTRDFTVLEHDVADRRQTEGGEADLPAVFTGPLYVLEDENGDLFLSTEDTCGESTSRVALDDHKLWDAYFEACLAANRARRAVQDALRVPRRRKATP